MLSRFVVDQVRTCVPFSYPRIKKSFCYRTMPFVHVNPRFVLGPQQVTNVGALKKRSLIYEYKL